MNQVVKSRWSYHNRSNTASAVLESVGVEFRKAEGQTFWEANAHQLDELLAEFLEEAGPKLLDLHPDRTLQATDEQFAEFKSVIDRVKKMFARHGALAGKQLHDGNAVEIKRGKLAGQAGFYKTDRALRIARLLMAGEKARITARMEGASPMTVHKIKKLLVGKLPDECRCGLSYGHGGLCVGDIRNPALHQNRNSATGRFNSKTI